MRNERKANKSNREIIWRRGTGGGGEKKQGMIELGKD